MVPELRLVRIVEARQRGHVGAMIFLHVVARWVCDFRQVNGLRHHRMQRDVVARQQRAPVWKSKFYGAFVLNRRVDLHAIDATPARWRGGAGSSPLDGASTRHIGCTRHTC